jgi:hypothetical protein
LNQYESFLIDIEQEYAGWEAGDGGAYLGEKVVREKEYLSAMITVYTEGFPAVA